MEREKVEILIAEENSLLSDIYEEVIRHFFKDYGSETQVFIVDHCDGVLELLARTTPVRMFSLAFIDWSLPPSSNKKFLNGMDVASYFRDAFPLSKLLFTLTECSYLMVQTLVKRINPEAIVLKMDLSTKAVGDVLRIIMNGGFYYDEPVKEKLNFSGLNIFLDPWDFRLLYELSIGARTSDLLEILPFSRSTIARRKRRLKEILNVPGQDDRRLIERAKEMGFI